MDLIDEVGDSSELRPWKLGQEVGQGANGVVYAATDRANGQARAVKLIRLQASPDGLGDAHVRREIDTCISLLHPNVVRTYAGGRTGPFYYLVMELCDGGSLASAITRGGPLPVGRAVALFRGLLAGLEYAHTLPTRARTVRGLLPVTGLVHRDIKPSNILLMGASHAKIGDFGLVKAFETAGLSGLTRSGFTAGTPAFMPRHQVLDFKYASPAVDGWAAVASLYYALSGHPPRDFPPGRDPWRVVWDTEPVPLADRGVPVPAALARVIDGALQDGQDDLPYQTIADLRAAVELASRADNLEVM